ncbi:MAG: DUF4383 domain-containing protein [Nocardioides sp.]|nr:DUF4383 domain-containing protein [Nocardioides sp.]
MTATPLQTVATVFGAVFLLVGVLGFVPGVTTGVGDMTFAGHESGAMLLGIFQVSILHNIVHLLFGVAGLALARTFSGARNYLIGGGAIYFVVFLYGLFVGQESSANFVPLNNADNWLHLVLAIAMVAAGVLLAKSTGTRNTHGTVR